MRRQALVACALALAAPAFAQGAAHDAAATLAPVLLALTAVVAAGLALGKVVGYLGQPPVIGEVLAGIALGPSLLGPRLSGELLPASVAPLLGIVAQLGILLYMFTVGLELSGGAVRQRPVALAATSLASMAAPFALGAALAYPLYARYAGAGVAFVPFLLFLGVSLSVTAFPVLARILADRQMQGTEIGSLALACAAIGDLAAWCLLALVVGVAQAEPGAGLRVAIGAVVYVAFMLLVIRPAARRVVAGWGDAPLTPAQGALVYVALLLSSWATERIGIHAIFGAFLLGAVLPHDSAAARTLTRQIQPLTAALLLPAFFALTGMRTRLDLLTGVGPWLACLGIIAAATVGKFGGTYLAARATGVPGRDAAVLGALMNTRGLMELIVLNIGLDLGVLSPTLFAMLVVMAIATTLMTAPMLQALLPRSRSV